MRFSNNNKPEFTDQEAMCIYLFSVAEERRFQKLEIYCFAKNYMSLWFPSLPSYSAFSERINRLEEAFKGLCAHLFENFIPMDCPREIKQIDFCPIINCSHKRKPKEAEEITDKSYCATKSLHYHELELHALTFYRKGALPFPQYIELTKASVNGAKQFEGISAQLSYCTVFARIAAAFIAVVL